MMGVKGFLQANLRAPALFGANLPPTPALEKAVRRLELSIGEADGSPLESADDFVVRVLEEWSETGSTRNLTSRELRNVAYNLHHCAADSGLCLSNNDAFWKDYLRTVEQRPSVLLAKRLTALFLQHFGKNRTLDDALARILKAIAATAPTPQLTRLITHRLVDAEHGPHELGRLVASADIPNELLSTLGFESTLARTGFEAQAFGHFCRSASQANLDPESIAVKVLEWGTSSSQRSAMKFPEEAGNAANALLLPWAYSGQSPSKSIEAKIKQFLISTLGDPRFRTASARWSTVSAEARTVLKRWMNRASVFQFFDIVDETMDSPDARRMWRYRRAFWTCYLDHIEDAWVVFGPIGRSRAFEAAHRAEDKSLREFGTFNTSGAQSSHAVLILTLGDLTIAEWSHNGKCRMWASPANAIQPYQKYYSVSDLRNGDWEASHTGNEQYRWQMKFADKIRSETGIRKPMSDYRV
jgi:hypothetical protein